MAGYSLSSQMDIHFLYKLNNNPFMHDVLEKTVA